MKYFLIILSILLFLSVVTAVFFAYQTADLSRAETKDWKTYINQKVSGLSFSAFSISFPNGWKVTSDRTNIVGTNESSFTLTKENYVVSIIQAAPEDDLVCIFDDSPVFEGPSGDFRTASYVQFESLLGTFRRVKQENPYKKFLLCRKNLNDYYGMRTPVGYITYEVPVNINPKILEEMDEIIKNLKSI